MKIMNNFDIFFINAISDFQILKIHQFDCHIFLSFYLDVTHSHLLLVHSLGCNFATLDVITAIISKASRMR